MEPHPAYAEFPIICCGLDWLTCTSKWRGVGCPLEDYGKWLLTQECAADGQISAARRLGYVGHRTGSAFLGRRPDGVMVQISGPRCAPLADEAIRLSDNVSRIDLQVTVWTEGELPNLANWTYRRMTENRPKGPAAGALTLITNWPDGGTLGINRRCSEAYGRLYDKSEEAHLGEPRTVWRYELELKGTKARRLAKQLREHGTHPTHVNKLVHAFYTSKGVRPAFSPATSRCDYGPSIATPTRDVLTWFRKSLSKTISAAIHAHGRDVVLDALGLSNQTAGGSRRA